MEDYPYIISAVTEGAAREIAEQHKLSWKQCFYVPKHPPFRKKRMSQFSKVPQDHILGNFSPEEILLLTM